jgi:hypothetical protein
MTLEKRVKLWTVLSVAVINLSCAHYKVYDKEVCGDLGDYGAHCNHTLVDKPRDIPKAQWDRERVGMLCLTSEGFNDTETVIDQFCQDNPRCDFVTRESLRAAISRVRGVIQYAQPYKNLYSESKQ